MYSGQAHFVFTFNGLSLSAKTTVLQIAAPDDRGIYVEELDLNSDGGTSDTFLTYLVRQQALVAGTDTDGANLGEHGVAYPGTARVSLSGTPTDEEVVFLDYHQCGSRMYYRISPKVLYVPPTKVIGVQLEPSVAMKFYGFVSVSVAMD